jgi:hypothetical protein
MKEAAMGWIYSLERKTRNTYRILLGYMLKSSQLKPREYGRKMYHIKINFRQIGYEYRGWM